MTLLLRLAAPLQSWGINSKFNTRQSEKEPSKSGVIGLLAAALGRKVTDDISDLAALKFGVRTDKQGSVLRDYHTATVTKAGKNGKLVKVPGSAGSYVTNRFYLQDAVFVAAVEGDDVLIKRLEDALRRPKFPMYLGRRSCPPTLPLLLHTSDLELEAALRAEPRQAEGTGAMRIMLDDANGTISRNDTPVSFNHNNKRYATRIARATFTKGE
ncbi:MAG: type I-E CRISPR-associated protein Cas5/CasD [Oscillospiraceae bacterium]|jgi:CRISPR system Cascade subunit CasD|nr:type I-E CRISPR-associated protein Cas5/CasD [Oscillospiraceae bacterium]